MNPIQKLGLKTRKRVVSISNKIKYDLLDYYFDPSIIVELHKNFGRDKIDSILNKFSKKKGGPRDKIIDEIDMFRNPKQSLQGEIIAERAERLKRQEAKSLKRQEAERFKN